MLRPLSHLDDTDAAIRRATVKLQGDFRMLSNQRLKPQPSSDLEFLALAILDDTYLTEFPSVFQSSTYQSHRPPRGRCDLGGTF